MIPDPMIPGPLHRGRVDGQRDPELVAIPCGLDVTDFAAQQRGQALADDQSQPGAGPQRGAVLFQPGEWLEPPGTIRRIDGRAEVAYRQPQDGLPAAQPGCGLNNDLAGPGVFHGVADQVHQHLPKPSGIAVK